MLLYIMLYIVIASIMLLTALYKSKMSDHQLLPNSLCMKGNNTCEKAERIPRNTAINDAYRKQRLLEKEINTSQAILQREYPLEYEETADFINKQFERHKEMFFERKMK